MYKAQEIIDSFYSGSSKFHKDQVLSAVHEVIDALNSGNIRVSEKSGKDWVVNEYIKKAILLLFKLTNSSPIIGTNFSWFDKVPLKEIGANPLFRLAPGAIVRKGVYIGKSAIIMPSFINIGAYIGESSMVDSMVTIGSCAQIGERVHIGANSCIGGVLEPVNASPVVIEDNSFIGACCSITEGVIVEENCVIASGVHLTASSKIIDSTQGNKVIQGKVPAGSVVLPGAYQGLDGTLINAAIIKKKIDANTRQKLDINEILRN